MILRAIERATGQEFAMKKLRRYSNENALLYLKNRREICIHFELRHAHIVRLFGFFDDFEHDYMVLEYARGGSLRSYLRKRQFCGEAEATQFALGVSRALEYIHARGIVHRDVKPENVLLDEHLVPKVCDFGLSEGAQEPGGSAYCGTLNYMAPEVFANARVTPKTDVWALGVLFYELLNGCAPLNLKTVPRELVQHHLMRNALVVHQKPVSMFTQNIIQAMLTLDPRQRPDARQVAEYLAFRATVPPELSGQQLQRAPEREALRAPETKAVRSERPGTARGEHSSLVLAAEQRTASSAHQTPEHRLVANNSCLTPQPKSLSQSGQDPVPKVMSNSCTPFAQLARGSKLFETRQSDEFHQRRKEGRVGGTQPTEEPALASRYAVQSQNLRLPDRVGGTQPTEEPALASRYAVQSQNLRLPDRVGVSDKIQKMQLQKASSAKGQSASRGSDQAARRKHGTSNNSPVAQDSLGAALFRQTQPVIVRQQDARYRDSRHLASQREDNPPPEQVRERVSSLSRRTDDEKNLSNKIKFQPHVEQSSSLVNLLKTVLVGNKSSTDFYKSCRNK